jgi:hypothetical protein
MASLDTPSFAPSLEHPLVNLMPIWP